MMKLLCTGLFCSVMAVVVGGMVVNAQQVQLRQEIKPLLCTYTSAQLNENAADDACYRQIVPTLYDVQLSKGRLLIRGFYLANQTAMLRIGVGNYWYTLGDNFQLTAVGNSWTLILSLEDIQLMPGTYNIAIETKTFDDVLLRNATGATLVIPRQQSEEGPEIIQPITKREGVDNESIPSSPLPTTVALPTAQSPPQAELFLLPDFITVDQRDVDKIHTNTPKLVVGIVGAGLLTAGGFAVVGYIRRLK